MSLAATRAYRKVCRTSASGRQIEAIAFAKAARLLEDARQASADPAALDEALSFTHLIWTMVQAETTDPRSPHAPLLKSALISLSLFVDRKIDELKLGHARAPLAALIEINRDMASGLFATPKTN